MLCRVLVAVIGVSYLVCVLFLSGIQKEDLDVSLLNKLQNHNIDYDKNNEPLRAECINNSRRDSDADSEQNTTETEISTTTCSTVALPNSALLESTELKSILHILKHKKKFRTPHTTETINVKSENSDTLKRRNNLNKIKNLFEKLTLENDDYTQVNYDSTTGNYKTEFTNKYKRFGSLEIPKSESQFVNTTENKTSLKTIRQKDNGTKEMINQEVDISNLGRVERILQMLAEYLRKKNAASTITSNEFNTTFTEPPKINNTHVSEIEQFASGIAVINKLNENIAILLKNINKIKLNNSNISIETKLKAEDEKNNLPNGADYLRVNKTKILTTPLPEKSKNILNTPKISTNTKSIQNISVIIGFVNNSLGELALGDKDFDPKKNQMPLGHSEMLDISNTLDSIAIWNKYHRQMIPEYLDSSKSNRLKLGFSLQDVKEITNYSYKQQEIVDDKLPHMLDPQHLKGLTTHGSYTQMNPKNSTQEVQPNIKRNAPFSDDQLLSNGIRNVLYSGHEFLNKNIYNNEKIGPQEIKISNDLRNVPNSRPHLLNKKIYKNDKIQPQNLKTSNYLRNEAYRCQQFINNDFYQNDKILPQANKVSNVLRSVPYIKHQLLNIYNNGNVIPQEVRPSSKQDKDVFFENSVIYPQAQIHVQQQANQDRFDEDEEPGSHVLDFQKVFDVLKNKQLAHLFLSKNEKDAQKIDLYKRNRTNQPEELKIRHDNTKFLKNSQTQYLQPPVHIEQTVYDSYDNLEHGTDFQSITNIMRNNEQPYLFQSKYGIPNYSFDNKNRIDLRTDSNDSISNMSKATGKPNNINITLSSDMISKIAESVKDIVLKDIKKEIILSTKLISSAKNTPSQTKITIAPTVIKLNMSSYNAVALSSLTFTNSTVVDHTTNSQTIGNSKFQAATQAFKNCIQLFEQLKFLQDKNVKHGEKRLLEKPKELMNNTPQPLNQYGASSAPEQTPVVFHNYMTPAMNQPLFPPSYSRTIDETNSISHISKPKNFETQHYPNVIMIQTNSHEIQPLGVPLLKPEVINIIVSTPKPFLMNQETGRWGDVNKYSRSPEKPNDFKSKKYTYNVYLNKKTEISVPSLKYNRNQEAILGIDGNNTADNNENNIIDRVKADILRQRNQYNQPRTSNNQINPDEVSNKINKYKNPNHERLDTKVMYNTIPQLAEKTNQVDQINPYKDLDILYQNMNEGPTRPSGVLQNFPIQYITKEKTVDKVDQNYEYNVVPDSYNPIINETKIITNFKNKYLNSEIRKSVQSIDEFPPHPHQREQIENFNSMSNIENKYSSDLRPTLEHKNHILRTSKYAYDAPNFEKYFDSRSRTGQIKWKETDYVGPSFKVPKSSTEFSDSDKITEFKDLNRYNKIRDKLRPFHRNESYKLRGGGNSNHRITKQNTDRTEIDLIKELFGIHNKNKNYERSDDSGNNRENHEYRPHLRSTNDQPKDFNYNYDRNIQGFHRKLENSNNQPEIPDDDKDNSSVKILPRQQVPMTAKKTRKYDDKRFQTLLQTQQKVNKMLEMILAANKSTQINTPETTVYK